MAKKYDVPTNRFVEIYGLYDPVTDELRYIGKANDSTKRLKSHIRDARRRNTPVCCWINSLGKRGLVPTCRVIETTDDWISAEKRLIEVSRARGARILNLADGGNEPFCDPETRRKNGAKTANAVHSDPYKKRLWAIKKELMHAHRFGLLTDSAKEKMRYAMLKRPDLFGCFAKVFAQ